MTIMKRLALTATLVLFTHTSAFSQCEAVKSLGDLWTFTVNTHNVSTGVATDADSVPSYRIYEEETTAPILTGTMALLDSVNTAGFYSEQVALSTGNGFEMLKSYSVYISATVSTITGTKSCGVSLSAFRTAPRGVAYNNFQFAGFSTATGSPQTGLTFACRVYKDGTGANCANPVAELAEGLYDVDLTATEFDGESISLILTAPGATDVIQHFRTQQ